MTNINDVYNNKNYRNNTIIETELKERICERSEEWETKSVHNITGNIECHNKTSAGESHNKIRCEANLVEVFRTQEQERNAVPGRKILGDKAEHNEPEQQQQVILFKNHHKKLYRKEKRYSSKP